MIQGSWINVFDYMTPAEISAVSSGTGANVTVAIKAAVNAAATNGTVYFPSGLYICDPIVWNVGGNPALSNKTFIGASAAFPGGYQASPAQQTRIVASGANAVFWLVNYAHRFTMQNMVLDGNGVSDIVLQLQQGCTKQTYTNVWFVNATPATGILTYLGDPVINVQVDMIEFNNCGWRQPDFAGCLNAIKLQQTNTFLITFRRCIISDASITILLRGVDSINIEKCEFGFINYGIFVQGNTNGLKIVDCYSESSGTVAFLTYSDQVYGPVKAHVFERNTIQGSTGNTVVIDPKVPFSFRNNLLANASGYIQVNAEVVGQYTAPIIQNNVFKNSETGINDLSGKAICNNNTANGVALTDTNYATYSQGTWSPTAGAGLTVVGAFTSSGTWTRIGRQVTISGTVTGATSVAVTAAGVITNNLPFTAGTAGHGSGTNAANTAFASVICTTTNVTSAGAIAATATITFSATYFV